MSTLPVTASTATLSTPPPAPTQQNDDQSCCLIRIIHYIIDFFKAYFCCCCCPRESTALSLTSSQSTTSSTTVAQSHVPTIPAPETSTRRSTIQTYLQTRLPTDLPNRPGLIRILTDGILEVETILQVTTTFEVISREATCTIQGNSGSGRLDYLQIRAPGKTAVGLLIDGVHRVNALNALHPNTSGRELSFLRSQNCTPLPEFPVDAVLISTHHAQLNTTVSTTIPTTTPQPTTQTTTAAQSASTSAPTSTTPPLPTTQSTSTTQSSSTTATTTHRPSHSYDELTALLTSLTSGAPETVRQKAVQGFVTGTLRTAESNANCAFQYRYVRLGEGRNEERWLFIYVPQSVNAHFQNGRGGIVWPLNDSNPEHRILLSNYPAPEPTGPTKVFRLAL